MIKYYTYYSCGGYKDIYIGSDTDPDKASYFIPLLNVWKKSNKPGTAEKIARAESVRQVTLISQNNSAGFPLACNRMFSHGGYKAMLRTLSDGRVCLGIRDIPNGAKDEEGRDVPFNFLFLADTPESIRKLDGLALKYLSERHEIDNLIADAITYDHIINGVRFDLTELNNLFCIENDTATYLEHSNGTVDYLIAGSRNQASLALTEQGIEADMVKSIFDSDGLFQGELRYKKESSIASENNNKQDMTTAADPSANDLHTDNLHEQSDDDDIYYDTEADNEDEGACTIEDFFKNNLDQKISFHVLMKEVEIMQAKLNNLTRQEEQTCKSLRDIMYSLDRSIITESNKTNRKFSIADYKFHIIELVMTAILSLIAGVTLGALIFLKP